MHFCYILNNFLFQIPSLNQAWAHRAPNLGSIDYCLHGILEKIRQAEYEQLGTSDEAENCVSNSATFAQQTILQLHWKFYL